MGYIGPVIVRHLRENYSDAELIGFDAGYFASALTTPFEFPERLLQTQLFGDVRHVPESVFSDVTAVIHLAAISNDPMGKAFERVTMDVNHAASIDVAKKAKKAGVKSFVFASSCSVYGFAEGGARNESSNLNPLTAYARSKVATEEDLKKLAGKNFKVTCLRFATACGMSPRLRLDLVLNDFVASAVALKKINILSDGSPWRPLIDVKDMARAMDWSIGRDPRAGGEFLIVNVGSSKWNFQVKDLARTVQRLMPEVEVSINKDAQPDNRSYKVDFSLFQKLAPNHQPKKDLAATIQELKEGLEAVGFADPNFRESLCIRLRMLNHLKSAGRLDENLYWNH